MGQKSWKVKLLVKDDAERQALQRIISCWNDGVRQICTTLLAMRRGDYGASGKAVWEHVSRRSTDYHVLYWLTQEPHPLRDSVDVKRKLEITGAFRAEHGFHPGLIQARQVLGPMWMHAIKAAVERIKSYEAHMNEWRRDHEQWIKERAEWEASQPSYMRLRTEIDAFNDQYGRTRRWNKWHKWLEFLQKPQIVDWKHEGAMPVPLSDEETSEARRDRRRAIIRMQRLLFKKNPQLEELNRLNREYERRFARKAQRRSHDGFRHPPTLTLPSLPHRPDWPRFQHAQANGWKNLDVVERTLEIRLPNTDAQAPAWLNASFVSDPRLLRLRLLAQPVKPRKGEIFEYSWINAAGQATFAQPQGLKLIQRGETFFAAISIALQPIASPIPVPQSKLNAVERSGPYLMKILQANPPESEVVTCAVDLAVRHLGAATIAKTGKVIARRLLHNEFFLPSSDRAHAINIPTLKQLEGARRALSRARSKTGGTRLGDRDFAHLRERYRHLKDDRVKKSVAAVFQYALHHGAQIVVFEDLQSLRPDAALDRGLNRAMQRWNRGAILRVAQQIAEDYGLRVVTIAAAYTSRICSACDGLGIRYEQGERRAVHQRSSVVDRHALRLAALGQWFFCPQCGRRIHADLNASENLHRVLLGTFPKPKSVAGGCSINGEPKMYVDVERTAIEALGIPMVAR